MSKTTERKEQPVTTQRRPVGSAQMAHVRSPILITHGLPSNSGRGMSLSKPLPRSRAHVVCHILGPPRLLLK
eukprot:15466686-Alexandrium_andersonii.AAC.1